MSLSKFFEKLGKEIKRSANGQRKRKTGPECTPCAAEAYVNGLREKPAKKARRK